MSWVVGKLPKTVLQGWMEYATPALQVVIVPYQLGSTRELGGALSRNLHRGSINL